MSKSERQTDPVLLFKICSAARDLQAAFAVRAIVFMDEQDCPFNEEFDRFDIGLPDNDVIHIVGLANGEAAAAARIRLMPGFAKLERLSIRSQWRGNGNGHQLLLYMMQVAQQRGFQRLELHAQTQLTGFYESHGFVADGPIFQEAGIDHQHMFRE